MLLAIGGDGKKGNREKIPENMGQMGKEAESAVKILEELRISGKCQRYSHGTMGGPVCDPHED